MPTIHFYLDDNRETKEVDITPLSSFDEETAIEELRSLSHVDVEVCYFTALMKVLEKLDTSKIDDSLYENITHSLSQFFYLYRYYKLPAVTREHHLAAASGTAGAIKSKKTDFSKIHSEWQDGDEKKAYTGLTRLTVTKGYLAQSLADKGKSLHPASLFTTKALKAQKRTLRYLSYCADPFCSLLDRGESLASQYADIKSSVIRNYINGLTGESELCYIGFASGLFGRDTLTLIELLDNAARSHKAIHSLSLIFIDPEYKACINEAHHKPLKFEGTVRSYLFTKAFHELLSLIQGKISGNIHCHLFSNSREVTPLIQHMPAATPVLFVGEDYFSIDGNGFSEDSAEADMRQLREQLLAHFDSTHSFQSIKNDGAKSMRIEVHKPDSAPRVTQQALSDTFRRH